jgi:hypothetical protein
VSLNSTRLWCNQWATRQGTIEVTIIIPIENGFDITPGKYYAGLGLMYIPPVQLKGSKFHTTITASRASEGHDAWEMRYGLYLV